MTDRPLDAHHIEADGEVDVAGENLPVLAEVRPIEQGPAAALPALQSPAVQAAAVVATSFVAGAATVTALRRARSRKPRRRRRKGEAVQVLSSRSFLVDVHLLAPRD
jgi:hypothetical protein